MKLQFSDRQAKLEDLPEILEIEYSAFPKERWASEQSLKSRIELYPQGSWLVLKDQTPIAFANGFPIKDLSTQIELDQADYDLFDQNGFVWLLRNVAVKKEYQHCGCGKLLINHQIKIAKDFGAKYFRFTATTDLNNYYSALGFKMIKEPEVFHGVQQGIWSMEL